MKNKSIFEKFTNQYSLSKTLRFELKPVGEMVEYTDPKSGETRKITTTEKMLIENRVFQIDENIQKKYEQTKPFFNKLHRKFVQDSLRNVVLGGLREYLKTYKEFIKDRKNKFSSKELEKKEKDLRGQIKKFFDSEGDQWKKKYEHINFKKSGKDILFEVPQIFVLLKELYGKEDNAFLKNEDGEYVLDKNKKKISIFDSWKNFGGYFTKFFETRKNFYKDDGTSTAVATRIIDQNLRRFCDNLILFEGIRDKIDFSEVEQNFDVSLSEYFNIQKYSGILLQSDINIYNKIIGGETKSDGTKLKGLNEFINKYRQDNKGEKPQFFKKLDKQILSEEDRKFIDEIESDDELGKILEEFVKNSQKKIKIFDELIDNLVKDTESFDLDKIYISKSAFNTISYKWTHQTHSFEKALYEAMKKDKPSGLKYDKKEDIYKFPDFIALQYVINALNSLDKNVEFWKGYYYKSEENEKGFLKLGENIGRQFLQIYKYELDRLHRDEIFDENEGTKKVGIDYSLKEIKTVLNNFKLDDKARETIKDFADDILHYYQVAKYFSVEKKREWNFAKLDLGVFYTNPDFGYEKFYENAYEEIVQIYNKIRNYLTKKPFSEEKWKLNFENPTLAGGWDKNKERDNTAVIFRKNNRYFLGIMRKDHNDLFADKNKDKFVGEGYEKMVYKYFPTPSKMIPKTSTQVSAVRKHFKTSSDDFYLEKSSSLGKFSKPLKITKEIFELNNFEYKKSYLETLNGKDIDINKRVKANSRKDSQIKLFQKEFLALSKNEPLYKKSVHNWIDFCKSYLDVYPSTNDNFLPFKKYLKNTKEYFHLDEFYRDLERGLYRISWQNISEEYIKDRNKNGELYLFEIHNKDWNEKSTGRKNLHTLYFGSLFSPENEANNFVMKLSGEAELFFRPKSLDIKKEQRNFKREIIVNKRYTEDKIFLHLSITLNRNNGNVFGFNREINNFLANNPKINIIGVDRGEKHLAYYSVVNQKGEILDSGSLNKIGGVNYYDKLTQRAKTREGERKDWKQVSDIKNLKKGYISQVVRKLADLAIRHNAIIVLEDLNMRFKQIRGGIEKSIYQQLEKALIEKLNFLVDKKEKNPIQAGHLLRAYQLTAPFTTFKDMGKQTGVIFYTQANYTSKIDPLTGWRPNLYLKKGNAEVNKRQIIAFEKIFFNQEKNRFEFTYDLKKFDEKMEMKNKKDYPQKTEWTLCSSVERWHWNRKLNSNKGGYDHYENLTDGKLLNPELRKDEVANFKDLFQRHNIDITGDILEQIKNIDTKGNERFFSDFIYLWGLLCQIRNTNGNLDDKIKELEREGRGNEISEQDKFDADFILSPVEPLFDSRRANEFSKKYKQDLPQNGDANGAYNIARKGIIILNKISDFASKNGNCDKLKWKDLYISSTEWDNFVTKNR